jgi:hypothetical protein
MQRKVFIKIIYFLTIGLLFVGCGSSFKLETAAISSGVLPGEFDFVAATQGNSKIVLSWDSSSDATSYVVKYGTVSGDYSTTATTNATSPYEVTGLVHGIEYFFRVEAVNAAGSVSSTSEMSEMAIFLDDFDELDLVTRWQLGTELGSYSYVYGLAAGIPITTEAGELVIGESTNSFVGQTLETRQSFNFTDSWVSIEMSTPPVDDPLRYQEAGLWILNPDGDGWEIYKAGNSLYFGEWFYPNLGDFLAVIFDPVQHRFLRIRHELDDNTMNFEASSDGVTWNLLRFNAYKCSCE